MAVMLLGEARPRHYLYSSIGLCAHFWAYRPGLLHSYNWLLSYSSAFLLLSKVRGCTCYFYLLFQFNFNFCCTTIFCASIPEQVVPQPVGDWHRFGLWVFRAFSSVVILLAVVYHCCIPSLCAPFVSGQLI